MQFLLGFNLKKISGFLRDVISMIHDKYMYIHKGVVKSILLLLILRSCDDVY